MNTVFSYNGNAVGRRHTTRDGHLTMKVAIPETMWNDFAAHIGDVQGDNGESYSSLLEWVTEIKGDGTTVEFLTPTDMLREIRELKTHRLYDDDKIGPSMKLAVSQLQVELRKTIKLVSVS